MLGRGVRGARLECGRGSWSRVRVVDGAGGRGDGGSDGGEREEELEREGWTTADLVRPEGPDRVGLKAHARNGQ